jgi:hypothetical protein
MNLRRFFVVLGLLCFAVKADAVSAIIEVFPGRSNRGFDAFDISSERLANGDIQFTVTISPKSPHPPYGTSLGIVSITDHSESSNGLRSLASEKNGNVLKCVFSVTEKELDDPNLSFRLTHAAGNGGWAFITYFVRLKNFLKK